MVLTECKAQKHMLAMRRAKFITGSVAELASKPDGGHAWLLSLRTAPYHEASAALCALPGVGPKVRPAILSWAPPQAVHSFRKQSLLPLMCYTQHVMTSGNASAP